MDELFKLIDVIPEFMNSICFNFAPARTKDTLNRTQMRCIDYIGKNPNITVTKLSQILSIDAGAMSRILSLLSSKNLINRVRPEYDQRIVHLNLSPSGYEIFEELEIELHKHLSIQFSNFTKQQIDELLLALKTLQRSTSYLTKETNLKERK